MRGKTVVNLFIEPSTRTRTSFELSEQRLSADIINFNTEASSLKKGVITLLAVTGLTHRESYKDIFAVTILKTTAVFVIIGVYEFTGLY